MALVIVLKEKFQWNDYLCYKRSQRNVFANRRERLDESIDPAKLVLLASRVGAPLATEAEINEFMQQLPNWAIVEEDKVKRLKRVFTFNNFVDAMVFTQTVSVVAEQENHHPAILTEWGKVTVFWWSHKIKGLHVNDFIMAAKTDQL